jgi:hypothetical protein
LATDSAVRDILFWKGGSVHHEPSRGFWSCWTVKYRQMYEKKKSGKGAAATACLIDQRLCITAMAEILEVRSRVM